MVSREASSPATLTRSVDPFDSAAYYDGSTFSIQRPSAETFFESADPDVRAGVLANYESSGNDVAEVLKYAVFNRYARNVEFAPELLSRFGNATFDFTIRFAGNLALQNTTLPTVAVSAIWELLARSMVLAEEPSLERRQTLLRKLGETGDPAIRFVAQDALEALAN